MLMLAGVHDGQAWVTTDPAVIESRLQSAAETARQKPIHLIRNMPPSKRPKWW